MSEIADRFVAHLDREGDDYQRDRLHYGADLDPAKCRRATWYAIHLPDDERDPVPAGRRMMWWLGQRAEDMLREVLSVDADGETLEVLRQKTVRPLRPSAWAFADMHLDLVVTERRHLYEVKAPEADKLERVKRDPRGLVARYYKWQLSGYFHEARAAGLVDTASWVFVDRTSDGEPLEVPLEGDLLVPLEEIVAAEESKAPLVFAPEAPERVAGRTVVRVWKTKGRVEAHEVRSWQCRWCAFRGACQPGPEERQVPIDGIDVATARARAEAAWAAGSKTTPQEIDVAELTAGIVPAAPVTCDSQDGGSSTMDNAGAGGAPALAADAAASAADSELHSPTSEVGPVAAASPSTSRVGLPPEGHATVGDRQHGAEEAGSTPARGSAGSARKSAPESVVVAAPDRPSEGPTSQADCGKPCDFECGGVCGLAPAHEGRCRCHPAERERVLESIGSESVPCYACATPIRRDVQDSDVGRVAFLTGEAFYDEVTLADGTRAEVALCSDACWRRTHGVAEGVDGPSHKTRRPIGVCGPAMKALADRIVAEAVALHREPTAEQLEAAKDVVRVPETLGVAALAQALARDPGEPPPPVDLNVAPGRRAGPDEVTCPACRGTGVPGDEVGRCRRCAGRGSVDATFADFLAVTPAAVVAGAVEMPTCGLGGCTLDRGHAGGHIAGGESPVAFPCGGKNRRHRWPANGDPRCERCGSTDRRNKFRKSAVSPAEGAVPSAPEVGPARVESSPQPLLLSTEPGHLTAAEACAICATSLADLPREGGGATTQVRAHLDGGETVCFACWSHLPGGAGGQRKHMPVDVPAFLARLVTKGHAKVVDPELERVVAEDYMRDHDGGGA